MSALRSMAVLAALASLRDVEVGVDFAEGDSKSVLWIPPERPEFEKRGYKSRGMNECSSKPDDKRAKVKAARKQRRKTRQ